jgi:CRP/FNR family cyclic AMP-dependent transcriptional regulator
MYSPYGLRCVENCLTCHLRSESFFCALPKESLEVFNQIKHVMACPARAVIFIEGQTPHGIFMLCQGQAKLSTTSRDGKTLILRIAQAGDVLGLHATVTGKPHEVTVETTQACQLNFVSREDLLLFLKGHSDACLQAAQHISRDCQSAYDVVRSIALSHSMSARVAKFLLASATAGQNTDGTVRARLSLTHEDIAQIVGASRETVTRILSEFRKKDLAELRGSALIIYNKPALEHLIAARVVGA